jgi:hypothetical protein
MCLSVRGALWNRAWLRNSDSSLVGSMIDDAGKKMDSRQIFELLCDSLEKGQLVLPMGDCNDFDPKTGCRGHRYDSEWASKMFYSGRHNQGYSEAVEATDNEVKF